MGDVSISVVSHRQASLIANLLVDIEKSAAFVKELILTLNVEESIPFDVGDFTYPIRIVRNARPKGFGANHNYAFSQSTGTYFCVMNPDIRLARDPFEILLKDFVGGGVGVVAPRVISSTGSLEDSVREFPTPIRVIKRSLLGAGAHGSVGSPSESDPDWVAGMFMLFEAQTFNRISGFDERYFMYCEDVDICARLRLRGCEIVYDPRASVIHDARRGSRKSLEYFRWHVRSLIRFFVTYPFYRLPKK